jgi:hypothetical protein
MDSPDGFQRNSTKRKIMNSPIKTLSALVIGGFLAGTAIAGPGDAYGAGFASRTLTNNTNPVGIALFRSSTLAGNAANCPMTQENSKLIPNANSKTPGFTKVVTGYSYPGCVGTSAGTMSCKGSTTACATMLQGS